MTNLALETIVASLDSETQAELVAQVREVWTASRPVRPLANGGAPMLVLVTSAGELGWGGDGTGYGYSRTDPHGQPWPEIPQLWRDIADSVAGRHPWDCGLVNWYDPDASLGEHRDQDEADRSLPIVTISLGDAAVWSVRLDDERKPDRSRLETGDVTLLAGRTRSALHAVERIIPSPLFSPLPRRGRLSITMRVAG